MAIESISIPDGSNICIVRYNTGGKRGKMQYRIPADHVDSYREMLCEASTTNEFHHMAENIEIFCERLED